MQDNNNQNQVLKFVEQGGIKERMYAARTGYRAQQDAEMQRLKGEVQRLQGLLRENGIEF